ncbi:MAG TPA: sialidase family protein [Candidatus Dormibacteraeota bacterium]
MTWASINGQGIYRSTDGGRNWQQALSTNALITAIYDSGASLLYSTQDGLDITSDATPSVPATPTIPTSMNSVAQWSACTTCLVATTEHGGVTTSRDGGQTWERVQTTLSFDSVVSFTSTVGALFGMVATESDHNRGVWRSVDGGATWTRVLDQPLIDYALGLPNGDLLAFQWGVHVWRSTDGGASWTKYGDV